MKKRGKRPDKRIKAVKPVHHCSICDQVEVVVCGDVCERCTTRGITRRFRDRERIIPTIFEWLEDGRNVQKQR